MIKNILTQNRSLLLCYQQILKGDNQTTIDNYRQQRLLSQGIIFQWQRKLQIYPPYIIKFHLEWVETTLLPSLFEEEVKQWVGNNQDLTSIIKDLALWEINPFESEEEKQKEWITALIEKNLINNWETSDKTQHNYLQELSEKLTENRRNLILYRQIINEEYNYSDVLNDNVFKELSNLGIIYDDTDNHKINIYRLYQKIFNDEWAKTKLIWNRIIAEIKEWRQPNKELASMIEKLAEQYTLPINTNGEKEWVQRLINEQVINNWKSGNKEIHKYLQEKEAEILEKNRKVHKLLELYKLWQTNNNIKLYETIFNKGNIESTNSRAEQVLITSGIISKTDNKNLKVSNKLYKEIFDIDWINATKTSLKQRVKKYRKYLCNIITVPIVAILSTQIDLIATIFILIVNAVHNIPFLSSPTELSTNRLMALKQATTELSQLENQTRKKIDNQLPKFSDYKTVKPLLNLQTEIDNIYLLNEIKLSKNNAPVRVVTFDPLELDPLQPKRFIAGDDQGRLILYDYKGNELRKIKDFEGAITSIKYSKNGQLIAIASDKKNNRITLFENNNNPQSIKQLDFRSYQDSFNSVDFSLDGKYLVTGGENGKVILWEIIKEANSSKLKLVKIPDNIIHGNSIEAIKFTPDGNDFITVGEIGKKEEEVKLWNLKKILCHSGKKQKCPLSSEGNELNESIDIKPKLIPLQHLHKLKSVAVYQHENSQKLLIGVVGKLLNSNDSAFCLINITLNNSLQCKNENGVNMVTFVTNDQKNQNLLVTSSEYGKLNFWSYDSNIKANIKEKHEIKINSTESNNQEILSIDASFDGQYLITSVKDKTIRIWKLSNFWNPHGSLNFSKDGNKKITNIEMGIIQDQRLRLIISMKAENDNNQTMEIWDVNKQKIEFPRLDLELKNYNQMIVVEYENKSYLVVFNQEGIGKFFNLSKQREGEKGEITPHLKSSQNPKPKLIKTNGKYIILTYENGYLSIWDMNRKRKLLDYNTPIFNNNITDVSLSKDGKYLAAIGDYNKPKIYRINFDEKDLSLVKWETDPPRASIIQINPNNSNLVIAGKSGDLSVWSLEGKLLDRKNSSVQNHLEKIMNLQFSSDGQYFATLDQDRKSLFWKIIQEENQTKIVKIKEDKDVSAISVSPQYLDGTVIAIAKKEEGIIKLWNLKGQDLAKYKTEIGEIEHLKFSPVRNKKNNHESYENYIVAVDKNGIVKAWEINNAQKLIDKACNWLKEAYFSEDSHYQQCKYNPRGENQKGK